MVKLHPRGKPFLRWAGSKRKQVKRLAVFFSPKHHRYIEPFAGSACLFFELCPSVAILGDNNRGLIGVYRQVRDNPERLYRRLYRIGRDPDTYYRWREMDDRKLDPETRAVRFLYLNRNCFNGIFRTNANGHFNVPCGRHAGAYPTKDDLLRCSELLRHAKLIAGDFETTLGHVRAGDFVYLDPPFAVQSRRVFREYGARSFETGDIPRLAKALSTIHAYGADFLVSYADCSEARILAREWNAIRLPIQRHVAGFAGHRNKAYEWLITNTSVEMSSPSGMSL